MEVFNEHAIPRLNSLEKSFRSLYSNGSGGPPGYLETARAEDKKQFEQLFEFAEQGRENGETFKDFIKSYMTEREIRKRNRRRLLGALKVVLPVVGTITVGLMTLIWHSAAPYVQDLIRDHQIAHHVDQLEEQNHKTAH